MTSPCHALIDTGAQEATIDLWHYQRWVACLALRFGLQPVHLPIAEQCEAGGIGGSARIIGICEIPLGFGGLNG